MDLSFTSKLERDARRTPWSPDLSVLLATAAALQAASPTARMLGSETEDEAAPGDWLQALTDLAAPGRSVPASPVLLGGSFNPGVAAMLGEPDQ